LFCGLLMVGRTPAASAAADVAPDSIRFAVFRSAANSVSGWTDLADRYRVFNAQQLFDIINGGADEYLKGGLVNGVMQSFAGPEGKNADMTIEDFGNSGRAQRMVRQKRKTASEPKALPGTGQKDIFSDEVIGGCMVYLSSGRYYFELTFTGYEKTQQAIDDAELFVSAMIKKIK
jgi:hypothetical protein